MVVAPPRHEGALDVAIRLGELVARGSRSSVHVWGRGAVAKVPDRSTPEGWIHFEALYTAAVRDAGAPAPRLLGIEQVDGRSASIWERVHGPSMWQHLVDRPERCAHYGHVLAELHIGLFDLVPPVSLPSQRDRLACKIRRAADEIDPSLADALKLLAPQPSSPRLCHGDLHPGNVILSPHGPMIIDWFDASRGDPIADIARSSLLLLIDGDECPQHLPGADAEMLTTISDAYLASTTARLDVDDDALARWQAIEAVARIAEGVSPTTLLAVWHRLGATDAGTGVGERGSAGSGSEGSCEQRRWAVQTAGN
jgi:aminoglycoside phosphotransferase (APT) family kinase protein